MVDILGLPPQDLALPSFSVGRERGADTDAVADHVIQDEPISSFCPEPQSAPLSHDPVRSHDLTRVYLRTFEDTFGKNKFSLLLFQDMDGDTLSLQKLKGKV